MNGSKHIWRMANAVGMACTNHDSTKISISTEPKELFLYSMLAFNTKLREF